MLELLDGNPIMTLHLEMISLLCICILKELFHYSQLIYVLQLDFTQSLETESLSSTTRRSKTRQTEIKLKTDFHYTKTSKTRR